MIIPLQVKRSVGRFGASIVLFGLNLLPCAGHAQIYAVIHNFCVKANCSDGLAPSSLFSNGSSRFFGSTKSGGAYGSGTLFELTPERGKWKLHVLYNFCALANCTDGDDPNGGLIEDTAGNLYGTAQFGNQGGVVFKLTHGGHKGNRKLEVIYSFCSQANCADGEEPDAGLSYAGQSTGAPYDGKSPLFGTTVEGGAYNDGVVFELNRKGGNWIDSTLYSFCPGGYPCVDGDEPDGVIVQGSNTLLGVVPNGGPNGGGAVFRVAPSQGDSWSESTVYGFCSVSQCTDGAAPWGRLLSDASGNIYGETHNGGAESNAGVVYELTPQGGETVLHTFCEESGCPDGAGAYGGLIMDSSGNLFGATAGGGNEYDGGTLFELNSEFNVLYVFCSTGTCTDGENPGGPLVLDSTGNLFGTAANGGDGQNGHGGGIAFELTP
jgi:uncharacterized repeat protein (TIGR03803 family)